MQVSLSLKKRSEAQHMQPRYLYTTNGMEDLDQMPNPKRKPEEPKPKRKKVVRRKRKATSHTVNRRVASAPSNPKKELPRSSVSQPRDHLGRFARKTGEILWGITKGTAMTIVGTVKTA